MADASIYPQLTITRIQNPNKMWAIPIFGFVAKRIILIPVFIEVGFVAIYLFFLLIINSFIVLFTGRYWPYCYQMNLGVLRLIAKIGFFVSGLTDKYPGFGFVIQDNFSLDMAYPEHPNRLFAIPVFGILARLILLIPFLIYLGIIGAGARLGMVVSFVPVLFKGNYPETTFELNRDSTRLGFSSSLYFAGLSDAYPSFKIATTHMTGKIILIILGVLLSGGQAANDNGNKAKYDFGNRFQDQIQNQQPPTSGPGDLI